MVFSLKDVLGAFGYTLSLPERLVRSVVTLLGGATKILTDTVIPEPLRKSSTFTAIVGNAQRFLIEKVAEVQGAYEADKGAGLPDDFVARKIAGNVVEAAGMFSIHLSPLWVFAIASDVAQGSKVYLNRLVSELKDKDVISREANINELDGLLDALGRAGQVSAKVFEAPPVDLAGLKELRSQLTAGYQNVFHSTANLMPRIDTVWDGVERLARRDGVSVESILGLMTFDLGRAAGKALDTAFAVGDVATSLLDETIFRSYGETINRVQRDGAVTCLAVATQPFVDALLSHVSTSKETWTERLWRRVVNPLAAEVAKDTSEAADTDASPPPSDGSSAREPGHTGANQAPH
jgi:hypothetical protein